MRPLTYPRAQANGRVDVVTDIPFEHGATLALDLYLPQGRGPWPTTVYFHGGAWRTGARTTHADRCRGLARHGVAVASAGCRLATGHVSPAHLHDAAAAVCWVRGHGGRYGLTTEAIGAWGASTGGRLAVLLGTRPDPLVAAVAALFTRMHGNQRPPDCSGLPADAVSSVAGAGWPTSDRARPAQTALGRVPFLLVQGDADTRIAPPAPLRFRSLLVRRGTRNGLLRASDTEREDPRFGSDPVLSAVAAFFRENLA